MPVDIIRKTKELPQELHLGDVFAVTDGYDGDFAVVVLATTGGKLMLFDLDDLGNRWDDAEVRTVKEAVEKLKDTTVTKIEYIRKPKIDVRVTGECVKVF